MTEEFEREFGQEISKVIMVEQDMMDELEERLQRLERRNSDLQEDLEITRSEAAAYSRLAEIAGEHRDRARFQGGMVGLACGILASLIANLIVWLP